MKKHRRIITMILAMLLVISAAVFVSAASEEQEVVRLGEVQSLRETNSETYLLSDGSYECVVYAQDKYYLDDTDTLQLIDHTIKAQTSGLNTTYTNTAGSFDATFSGSGTPQVSIAYKGSSITFSPLIDISLDDPITSNDHVARIGKVDNCLTLESLTPTGSNTVTYANVFTATDLTYVLDNYGLKEYIILNSTDAPNEFSFMFQLDGLEMQTIENETFFMDEEGIPAFRLGQLFAVDEANELTNELSYSFTPVKNNTHVIVTVTLSEEYLSDPAREFPVVIDPSIMISSAQTDDTCVLSRYGDYNYYNSSYLRTGYDSDYRIRRSFIQFDIPSSIGNVTNARLDLETCGGVAPTMRAYRCTESWTSSAVTWLDQPSYSRLHYSGLSYPYREGSAWYVVDVTSIVQTWVNGTYSNYGFALVDDTEDDPDHWTTYYSSDMASPHKPELHITYEDPSVEIEYGISLSHYVKDIVLGSTGRILASTTPAGGTVTWYSSNSSIASVDSNGYVTGNKIGSTTITATSQGVSATCTVNVTLPDGVYLIQNKLSNMYMDIDIDDGGMSNGTAICQNQYCSSDTLRWTIRYAENNTYTIQSNNLPSLCYLGVNESSSAGTKPIVLRTGNITDAMKWRISLTNSGAYKLTPVSSGGSSSAPVLSLSTDDSAIGGGALLQKHAYTSDSDYRDEWIIYQNSPVILENVPTNLRSGDDHECVPCAITNIAAYWCVNGYSHLNCSTAALQETTAIAVQNRMNGMTGGHTTNDNIPYGFSYFNYLDGNILYCFEAINCWYSYNNSEFDEADIVAEIDAGRPCLLGFADPAIYGEAHMTVCVGYYISDGCTEVYVSDAFNAYYVKHELNIGPVHDFISKVYMTPLILG